MPHRRTAVVLTAAALTLTLIGCGDRTERRPPPPQCGPAQVAEWDDDGWECEPDKNRNGIDDEEDAERAKKKTKGTKKR